MSAIAALVFGALAGVSELQAEEKGSGYAQQIQGSWVLVTIYNEQDGKKTEPFGPNPRGSWIVASFGTYSVVSAKEQTVNLHMEGSTFPNWDGQDQKRLISVTGDEMKVTNPTPSIGGGTNYQVWKRAR